MAHVQRWTAEASHPPPIIATLANFGLVSIHPFEDGNGRTARLLADMILHQAGWSAEGMVSVNQVIWDKRSDNYAALREAHRLDFKPSVDATPFVRFHTEALGLAATRLEARAVRFRQRLGGWTNLFREVLTDRQALGLMYVQEVRPVSSSMYAQLTGASASSAYADLTDMVKRKVAVRTGKGRNTRYALHPDLQAKLQRADERVAAREA